MIGAITSEDYVRNGHAELTINDFRALASAGRRIPGRDSDRPRALREKGSEYRNEPDLRLRGKRRTLPRNDAYRE